MPSPLPAKKAARRERSEVDAVRQSSTARGSRGQPEHYVCSVTMPDEGVDRCHSPWTAQESNPTSAGSPAGNRVGSDPATWTTVSNATLAVRRRLPATSSWTDISFVLISHRGDRIRFWRRSELDSDPHGFIEIYRIRDSTVEPNPDRIADH